MPEKGDHDIQNAALLTKAVENVFRKFVRMLVGRISLVKLQEMMNYIYVEEAEKKLLAERQKKAVPMTKLALITGLDSRTVCNIRSKIESNKNLYDQKFLKDLTPESAIVEAWAEWIDVAKAKKQGNKATLNYGDDSSDFEKLFRSTISSRGITSQSIIQRLVAAKSIKHDRKAKTVTLVTKNFSPYLSNDEPQMFNAAFTAVSNLLSTSEHNILNPRKEKWFQRQVWTFRLSTDEIVNFREEMKRYLETVEQQSRETIKPWEADSKKKNLMSAGIGLYYFQE